MRRRAFGTRSMAWFLAALGCMVLGQRAQPLWLRWALTYDRTNDAITLDEIERIQI